MSNNGLSSTQLRPRLCHLRRWTTFNGYGFNLHSERNKIGQYIGKVDPNSPAESAGLRENDRIIEVNYAPVGNENHRQVVARIKEGVTRNGKKYTSEVILLVVDAQTDDYYKSKSMLIKSSDPNVEHLETENPDEDDDEETPNDKSNNKFETAKPSSSPLPVTSPSEYNSVTDFTSSTVTQSRKTPTSVRTKDEPDDVESRSKSSSDDISVDANDSARGATSRYINTKLEASNDDSSSKPVKIRPIQTSSGSGLTELAALDRPAAELRQRLKDKHERKRDPRQNTQMAMKDKHDYINKL